MESKHGPSHSMRIARCESGLLGLEGCSFDGPAEALALVEWIPEDLRASHTAAGNRGVYPHNGAIRAKVCPECLEQLLRADAEWTRKV